MSSALASAASATAAAGDVSQLPWGDLPPELWIHIASFLPPNEVACTLRLVHKAAAELLHDRTSVRLSGASPPHAFVWRWGGSLVWRDMPYKQRRRLLELTARSGSLANLATALPASGCFLAAWLFTSAAGGGHMHMCLWLEDQGCPCNEQEAAEAAARGGHLAVVRWLLARIRQQQQDEQQQQQDEQQQQQQDPHRHRNVGCAAFAAAAGAGHRALCEALLADGVTFDDWAPINAARGGHVGLTEWLLQLLLLPRLPPNDGGGSWSQHASWLLLKAAVHGFELPALQRLHTALQQHLATRDDPDPVLLPSRDLDDSLLLAALNSPTRDWRDKMHWLHQQGSRLQQINMDLLCMHQAVLFREGIATRCGDAVERVQVLLQLTHGEDDAIGDDLAMALAVGVAIRAGDLQLLQSLQHRVPGGLRDFGAPALAAEEGNLKLLRQMAAWGWSVAGRAAMVAAVRSGHLAVLQWLVGPEAGRDGRTVLLSDTQDLMYEAAVGGRVEMLEWMRAQGCSFRGESNFAAAASYGNVALLERLAGWGCPLEAARGGTYARASYNGDLATLRCLRRLGCPWGPTREGVFTRAVWSASDPSGLLGCSPLAALRWLLEEGRPVDWEEARRRAEGRRDPEAVAVRAWIDSQMQQGGGGGGGAAAGR
ncbi:hypothetical protein PLESTB_000964800 [Pleodorina starrii]|uniref:Ankyrin repeat domain-containing protein n=1 Tax=Pleodorina starrii TaxID=330485 RepID=A0A9W6BNW4_9CHLO|nr:hypothetical protein PLESTM_001133200 [Pleodorina starrii]GLC55255.1 hypothetical protein PLESTB_000964800 [Pleodorina starrii]GLC70988.1 hypothetical protein PLESTF_001058300 [Pleodorina starrii]GLC70990.1 hypothetical protein PLESTF_001058500 [Pleodorina starrii]